jgi:osmotically-inducible protein OsmY
VSQDFRINAQVRALFVRHNVDLTKVEHGATNGVVYVHGDLRSGLFDPSEELSEGRLAEAQFAHRIEKALRKLPGVRDVVFKLDRVVKVETRWKPR